MAWAGAYGHVITKLHAQGFYRGWPREEFAAYLADAKSWRDKIDRLLDLADVAPTDPRPRALAFEVLEQPLGEIVGSRAGMAELVGPSGRVTGIEFDPGLAERARRNLAPYLSRAGYRVYLPDLLICRPELAGDRISWFTDRSGG